MKFRILDSGFASSGGKGVKSLNELKKLNELKELSLPTFAEELRLYPIRPERAEAPSPGRALKKVPNFKLHSLFLNFNSCPRSISSFKSGILFWTGI